MPRDLEGSWAIGRRNCLLGRTGVPYNAQTMRAIVIEAFGEAAGWGPVLC
jgi:hypothetical protein